MGKVFDDVVREGMYDALMHHPADQPQRPRSEVLVGVQQILLQRVACQQQLVLEGIIRGRLVALYDLPVQQHDLPEFVALMYDRYDGGDDVHDQPRIRFVVDDAPHQRFEAGRLFLQVTGAELLLQFFGVGWVGVGTQVHRAVDIHAGHYCFIATRHNRIVANQSLLGRQLKAKLGGIALSRLAAAEHGVAHLQLVVLLAKFLVLLQELPEAVF